MWVETQVQTGAVHRSCVIAAILAVALFGPTCLADSKRVQAAVQHYQLNIPRQSLDLALKDLAQQTGLQIGRFSGKTDGSAMVGPVKGDQTAEQALKTLLNNTGLAYKVVSDTTIAVYKPKDASLSSSGSLNSPSPRERRVGQGGKNSVGRLHLDQAPRGSNSGNALQEITVTALNPSEKIHTLPLAIATYSGGKGEKLEERRIFNVGTLSQINSSVRVPVTDSNQVLIMIRGVGNYGGLEPSTALVMDGVPYANTRMGANSFFSFFDVDRVEVLSGPQGTMGGRNATAGGIYVTSKRPTETVEGYIKATIGNYQQRGLEGAIGGPLIGDKLLARVAVRTDRADGWIHNTLANVDHGNIHADQARLSLEARGSDSFRGLLTLESVKSRGRYGTVPCGRARPDRPSLGELNGLLDCPSKPQFQQDFPDDRDEKNLQAALRLEWELADSAKLTSLTGYYQTAVEWAFDLDRGPIRAGWTVRPLSQRVHQKSQELTLTGSFGDRLDYVVGGLYLHNNYDDRLVLVYLPVIPEDNPLAGKDGVVLKSLSGYGQLRYQLTNQIRLTAGARYTTDTTTTYLSRRGFANLAGAGEHAWSAWMPRVSLDWQPTDDSMAYLSVARGYRAGGFPLGVSPPLYFDPEYVWSYEAGLKLQGWNQRLQSDIAAFLMDYTNLQQQVPAFDPARGGFVHSIVNASSAIVRGVELNLEARPTDGLHFSAAATYLDARYRNLLANDPLYPELGTFDPALGANVRQLSGKRVIGAPKWQYNVSANYTLPFGNQLQTVLGAAYTYLGQAYSSIYNDPGIEGDAASLIDLKLTVHSADSKWQATAFVKNLQDKRYLLNASGGPPDYWRRGMPGDPRRYGVTIERRF